MDCAARSGALDGYDYSLPRPIHYSSLLIDSTIQSAGVAGALQEKRSKLEVPRWKGLCGRAATPMIQ